MLLTACNKDDESGSIVLPPAAQEGKNTFGCKVNGKNWVPGSDDWMLNVLNAQYVSQDTSINLKGWLEIGATKSYGTRERIGMTIYQWPSTTGTFNLKQHLYPVGGGGFSSNITHNGSDKYFSDNIHTGEISITKFDTINHIVSGTFYFQAKLEGGTETVNVTDGRFDISYYSF